MLRTNFHSNFEIGATKLRVRRTLYKAMSTWVLGNKKIKQKQIRKFGNGALTVSRRPTESDRGVPSPSGGSPRGPTTHSQALS